MANNVIPVQKIQDASGGNNSLQEILQALSGTTNLQQTVTNTAGKNVPVQAAADVSYLRSSYIVQIKNPGATSPTSVLQSAQATQGATGATVVQSITAIYHQIRAATSPRFSISDNVQTYGGNTGSTQTYWTLSDLPSGQYYFQIRSSYDGTNWNLWRNANGGQTITSRTEGVTLESAANTVWAIFELPGKQLVAIGTGFASDGGSFGLPENLYSSAMAAIPGPNGFSGAQDHLAHGFVSDTIAIVEPTTPQALTGPADYPITIAHQYLDGEGHTWPGSVNIFAMAYDPLGTNIKFYSTSNGTWVVFTLPGGAQLGFGNGVAPDGQAIDVSPAGLSWITEANTISAVSPRTGNNPGTQIGGIKYANIDAGLILHCAFGDEGVTTSWPASGNWFIIAWSPGFGLVETVTGGRFLKFNIPSGGQVAIGGGKIASGSSFTLPAGYPPENLLTFASPASYNSTFHPAAGVLNCSISGTTATLTYTDVSGNFWDGDVNWLCFAWRD